MKRTVLIVGGRIPAALELARLLHAAGHRVISGDSVGWHLLRFSAAVASNHRLPSPRGDLEAYVARLQAVIATERVDLLVPACEEVFWISFARDRLAQSCDVFVDRPDTLAALHGKASFVERARAHGLAVPQTRRVATPQALSLAVAALGADVVLKPEYSRFAVRTLIRPGKRACARVRPSVADPWVVQPFVEGRRLCSYSIAHRGRLTAHALYPTEHTLGVGATIAFRAIEHGPARAWVERFVAAERFTGQIAFDLVERPDGDIIGLECNPRATSGLHLFAGDGRLVQSLLDPDAPCITPRAPPPSMLAVAMLLALPRSLRDPGLSAWWNTFRASHDVVFRRDDPLPALGRYAQLLGFLAAAVRHRTWPRAASTRDIEWNGEPPW